MLGELTELVLLSHGVDKISWGETLVKGVGELGSGTVQSTTETLTDGQKTSNERRNEILSGSGGNDGVHGTGHSWSVIGSQHENHLQELGGVFWKTSAEPQKRHDTTDTNILLEDVGDWHSGVKKFLSSVVGDGGDESSWLTDETEFLGPRVIHWNLWWSWLWLWHDGTLINQLLVYLSEGLWELLKGLWNVESGILHGLVLGLGSLELRVGERTGVTELNLSLEHAGASTDGPGDNWLCDLSALDGLNDTVLFDTTDLTEKDKDLAVGISLISGSTLLAELSVKSQSSLHT